jgi:hypothetical protein
MDVADAFDRILDFASARQAPHRARSGAVELRAPWRFQAVCGLAYRARARPCVGSLSRTISITSSARSRASPRRGCRKKAPTMTCSRIVMSSNVAGICKGAPDACAGMGLGRGPRQIGPVKCDPAARGDAVAGHTVEQLDLPAPFGPIRPTISPADTESVGARDGREPAERQRSAAPDVPGPPTDALPARSGARPVTGRVMAPSIACPRAAR